MGYGDIMTKLSKEVIKSMLQQANTLEIEAFWLPKIMSRQTEAEQEQGATLDNNGIGLNKYDSEYIAPIWDRLQQGGHLTNKEGVSLQNKLQKYSLQYSQIIEV